MAVRSSGPTLRARTLPVRIRPAIFQNANLRGANLEGATIADTHFGGATWGNTTCPDGTNSDDNDGTCVGTGGIVVSPYVLGGFSREPNTPGELRTLDLGNCTFDGLDLRGRDLIRLYLGNCSFAGANLAGIAIRGSTLGGVDLHGANLEGTTFQSVDLTRANLTGVTGQPIFDHVIWDETTCPDGHTSGALRQSGPNLRDRFDARSVVAEGRATTPRNILHRPE